MAELINRDHAAQAIEAYICSQCDYDTDRDPDCIACPHLDGDEILKSVPAVNRWIPVEDALPEIKEFNISDTVLCYCDSGALAIARLEANGFGQVGFNCEKDDEYHHSAGNVLYWMPIPEIPEPPEKE